MVCRSRFVLPAMFVGVLAVFTAMLAPVPAAAQTLYGSIVGNVTDAQGAALPGVNVTATNTGTSLKLETVSNERGSYTFRNLPPGTYDVAASLEGFKAIKKTGYAVTAGNPIRVDLALELGSLSETVDVVAETTLLQTEKADLSTEITSKQVTTLPLNQYRNYQALMNLVPGATPVQFQNALIDTPGQSLRTWVNGTQPNSNATRIDGAVSVNIWLPHHVGYVQPAESIDTVNVSTNSFDADQGMAGGAASTVVTKSGTNQIKGSAFIFHNSDSLNENTYYNKKQGLPKTPLTRNIYGGTVGGPIVKNKLFYFMSWERFQNRQTTATTYTVPTAKMRAGDFSEVAAKYSAFKLFNPYSGAAGSRTEFDNFTIPANMISPIAAKILAFYPAVNTAKDLNNNSLLDDYVQNRKQVVDRDNIDLKLTFQRNAAHSIWAKFAVLDANVEDNFVLGFDKGSIGDTRVYVATAGHTWTLSPTLVLDGNIGMNRQKQTVTGPDYGTNYGIDLGIPGTNDKNDIRASGLPTFANGYTIGSTPNWMPLFRTETTYTFSTALTKVFPKHEIRAGVDVVRMELNHRQAEFGDYGLKGGFSFNGDATGNTGYTALQWNQFAQFLLGLPHYFARDTQTEEMTGREWQSALYVRDRWAVNSKLTVSGGLRLEHYPLMMRDGRGIEMLDYSSYTVLLGGVGDVPDNPGIKYREWYLAPRVGASYRLDDKTVVRAGYGMTINPLPWSRPMRGSFPLDINFNASADAYGYVTTLANGIPTVVVPDTSTGRVKLPIGVYMRSPNAGTEAFSGSGDSANRGRIQQWNAAVERKLPGDIALELAYVGTRTDGGYADLNVNYGQPGLGNAGARYAAVAGSTSINDWGSRTKSRYHAMQVAVNRPFRNGLMVKGAYTFSRAKNMADEDGWTTLTWNSPLKYEDNFALAGFDRTHIAQLGWLYELPFFKNRTDIMGNLLGGWQINGVAAWYSGTPFNIAGTNADLKCVGCGTVMINYTGDGSPTGEAGSSSETWYTKSDFSQPTGASVAGFGSAKRNQFRRPNVWNVDLSLFKAFQIGRVRPELRVEAANVFNHTNWGAPVTTFTALNFLQFTPASAESGTNSPGARRIQLGLRIGF